MTSSSKSQDSRKFNISLNKRSLSFVDPGKQPPEPDDIVASFDTMEKACVAMNAIETIYRKIGTKNNNNINWNLTFTITGNGTLQYFGDVENEENGQKNVDHYSNWYQDRQRLLQDKTSRTVYQIALPDVVFDPTRNPPLVPVPEGEIDPDSLLTFYETLEDAIVARDAIAAIHKKVGGLVDHVAIIVDTDPGRFYTRIYPDPEMNGEEMKPDTENLSRYDPDRHNMENRHDGDDLSSDNSADSPDF